MKQPRAIDYLRFIIPSIIGILIFMTPFPITDPETGDKSLTIPIAIISGWLQDSVGSILPAIMTFIIVLTAVLTLIARLGKPGFIMNNEFWHKLLFVSWFWVVVRVIAATFALIAFFQVGSSSLMKTIWSSDTGGLLLEQGGLLSSLFSVFLFPSCMLRMTRFLMTYFVLYNKLSSSLVLYCEEHTIRYSFFYRVC